MRIDIEEIIELKNRLDAINSIPLKDIEWYEKGFKMPISQNVIEEWRFVGLSNASFIECIKPEAFKNSMQVTTMIGTKCQ